jgi:threonine aldolase
MRFMAAQMECYIESGMWRRNAEHSNRMAQLLHGALQEVPQARVMYPVQVNSVFVQLPREVWKKLQESYFFYDWDEDADVVRWMCSFDTTEEDISNFVTALKEILAR